jgi:hypothetical protein
MTAIKPRIVDLDQAMAPLGSTESAIGEARAKLIAGLDGSCSERDDALRGVIPTPADLRFWRFKVGIEAVSLRCHDSVEGHDHDDG